MTTHHLTYAFDAYCGWCYGFGPALRQFAADHADTVQVRVMSGGLFSGAQAQPIGAFGHIPAANQRISALTGVTFGAPYEQVLAQGTLVMDSTDAARGLVALRRQAPERALELAGAMQRAWYVDGRDLSDPGVYRDIATAAGLDADAVHALYVDPSSRAAATQDFAELRRLGVESYPTLLLHTPTGVHRLGGPVSTPDSLTTALRAALAAASA